MPQTFPINVRSSNGRLVRNDEQQNLVSFCAACTPSLRMAVGFNPTQTRAVDMRSTQQFSITLPNEMADAVRAKVVDGEYATESEVIREGLRALFARDQAIEQWLQREVASAYDKLKADPSRSITPKRLRASLAKARATRDARG